MINDVYEVSFCTVLGDTMHYDMVTIKLNDYDELLDVAIRREKRRLGRKYCVKSKYVMVDRIDKKEPYESKISDEMLPTFKNGMFFNDANMDNFAEMVRKYRKLRYYDNNPLIKRATLSGECIDGTTVRLTEEITYEFKCEVEHG